MSVKNIVAEHKRTIVSANESLSNDESLCNAIGRGLNRILKVHSPLTSITQELLEMENVLRSGDDEDVSDARKQQRGQRVINHGFVIDRQQLFRKCLRDRVETST